MSSSSKSSGVRLTRGNLLNSGAHALVNTVNCVGVMGKGIALSFKKKYPEMYRDYVRRCNAGSVRLGEPYIYHAEDGHIIVNFPTKDHWRSVSRLEDIERGLDFLMAHLEGWGIRSIAVPPLGCGNGQLEWTVVGPTLHRHLRESPIPVELYVPHDVEPDQGQLSLLEIDTPATPGTTVGNIDTAWLAVIEILSRIESEPYHWPIGRIMFQKLVYFATVAGLPTGLQYQASDFGPYSPELNRMIGRLQNNGLVQERRDGELIETVVGRTFADAKSSYETDIAAWEEVVRRVTDLMARFNSRRAEIAGSVHYMTQILIEERDRPPTATEVIEAVERWKANRKPAVGRDAIAQAIVELAVQGWITVSPDSSVEQAVEELTGV